MMTHNVSVSAYGSSGQNVVNVDPQAVQNFANDTTMCMTAVETQIRDVHKRMDELESFLRWCAKHHQEVMDEFVVTQAARARIHHTEKA